MAMPDHLMPDYMTTTGAADYFTRQEGREIRPWQVRRAYETETIPEPATRAGQYRLIARDDLPALADALRRLGYLPAAPQAAA
jgi:hypothetical protein